MQKILKKHVVRIPKDINLIYANKKKMVTLINTVFMKKSFSLNVQIFINKSHKSMAISQLSFINLSRHKRKLLDVYQTNTIALIKRCFIEISVVLCKKLRFIGVGYRVFIVDIFKNKLLLFKLGYSHFLYFKILKYVNFFNLKTTKLFIFGNSYQNITQLASQIRLCKKPEPYKGKGILYDYEKIVLKQQSKKI